MSRIGRMPITVPAGVDVKIEDGNVVTVKGSKGTLTQTFNNALVIKKDGNVLTVERTSEDKMSKSLHGLTRALLFNMVEGVTNGYSKKLEIVGVGYKATKTGKNLVLNLGHSHSITFEEKDGITFDVPNANEIVVKGISKQLVGEIAAQIRSKRPPEPYLGKGVKYEGERIRRKAGKTGK